MPATRGKSYQLSKITNDSARGERGNVTLDVGEWVSPGTTGNLGPWSRHPAWGHTVTTNMATIPAMLTVLSVCHGSYSPCPPSVSPTVPTTPAVPSAVFHAHPAQHTHKHRTPHAVPGVPPYRLYPPYLPC